ncbi:MAG: hypothetical protein CMK74_20155 [Pseudomonadales bacterium]|nr:hypothetical protein [Pseudomonadales bacterium]
MGGKKSWAGNRARVVPTGRSTKKPGPHKRLEALIKRSLTRTYGDRHYIWKTHPDMFEGSGKPDLIGHIFGLLVGIEVKVSPDRPTPHQKQELCHINKTGGIGLIILFHKPSKKFYLVPPIHIENFSYKRRDHWVELERVGPPGDPDNLWLNLMPLTGLAIAAAMRVVQVRLQEMEGKDS